MIVISMIDSNGGMMFNNRRQSRDEELIHWIIRCANNQPIWTNEYSAKLFLGIYDKIIIDDDFLNTATNDAICFNETSDLSEVEEKIDQLILCCWNRNYPADVKLSIDTEKWSISRIEEIVGNSHERITITIYQK